jgi:hypothetical protein
MKTPDSSGVGAFVAGENVSSPIIVVGAPENSSLSAVDGD